MLTKGAAKKVTIYVNEVTRYHTQPLWVAIFEFLRHKQVAGATVSQSKMGFGSHQMVHRMDVVDVAELAPVRVEFVDTAERVDEVLPTLWDMVTDGLIEVQDTTIVKSARKGTTPEQHQAHTIVKGPAKLMRVFMGEADKWHDEPLYEAILKRLRMMDVAGATVYRGILGYGAKGHTHKQSFLHLSKDLPVMISVVDAEEKIAQAATAIEGMVKDGLIVLSDVDIIRLIHKLDSEETANANRTVS